MTQVFELSNSSQLSFNSQETLMQLVKTVGSG